MLGPIRRMLAAMLLGMFVTQNLRPLAAVASGADLEVLRELIEAGTITPPVDRSYPLAETPEAIRYFVEEHARGKITITVTSQNNTTVRRRSTVPTLLPFAAVTSWAPGRA